MTIRQATEQDVSRIAEILVFNNRLNFRPIFRDDRYSFGELQVVPLAESYLRDRGLRDRTFLYDDDGIVKGLIQLRDEEIQKLYVDPFFQDQGIGAALIQYAIRVQDVQFLWALEKNTAAIRFYQRHGFHLTQDHTLEEGTTEYLVRLDRRAQREDVH